MRITENRMILFSFDFQDEISYDVFTSSPCFIVMGSNSAVYKSGTGTRGRRREDACVGTWDLGTRDEGLEDIKYGTRGRQKQGRRGCGM